MNEKSTVVPTSVKTWKKHIPEIYAFKLLHRIITTRKELKRYNMANDDLCTRCSNPDSIEHTFINCHNSMHFYNLTLRWFNGMHNIDIYNFCEYGAHVIQSLGDHPGIPLLFGIIFEQPTIGIVLQFHGDDEGSMTVYTAAKEEIIKEIKVWNRVLCEVADALEHVR